MKHNAIFQHKCLLFLFSFFVTILLLGLSAGAEELPDWTVDPSLMNTTSDNGGSTAFSLTVSSGVGLTDVTAGDYTGKVLSFSKSQSLRILDTDQVLGNYPAFTASADFYFTAFPSGSVTNSAQVTQVPDPSSPNFYSLSLFVWINGTASYDGIRLDSEGNLYSSRSTGVDSALGVKLETGKWYNMKLVFSVEDKLCEFWLDGERVAFFSVSAKQSQSVRLFDGRYSFDSYVKNIRITASETYYPAGTVKEPSADFLCYQTTVPDGDGKFSVRFAAGIRTLSYDHFGYRVIVLTRGADGKTISTELNGTDTKAYSSLYGAGEAHSVKDTFGYDYACVATVTGLDAASAYTELVVLPYTTSQSGTRVYGAPMILAYYGEEEGGYPVFEGKRYRVEDLVATDDTFIYNAPAWADTSDGGTASSLMVRNPGNESSGLYRAAYYQFTIPAETASDLDKIAKASVRICVESLNDTASAGEHTRKKYDLEVYTTATGWDENLLTYNNRNTYAVRGEKIATISDYTAGSYFSFDILELLRNTPKNPDGSVTVSFCITNEDGHADALLVRLCSKESANLPVLRLENTLCTREYDLGKLKNEGYDPLGTADRLVDEWFGELYDRIYPTDAEGNRLYYEDIGVFAPEGYSSTTAVGDFVTHVNWLNGTVWRQTDTTTPTRPLSAYAYARTLSSLGTAAGTPFLGSSYAAQSPEYDVYGGVTNAGFSGTATGFFHTERLGKRFYIIDPLGNPYFSVGVNTIELGATENQKNYALGKYGSQEAYFNAISADLKAMGVNAAFGGDSESLLAVENGLPSVVAISVMMPYMKSLGLNTALETIKFSNNDTMNVFDPDFVTSANNSVAQVLADSMYLGNPAVLGYTTDNELPSGTDILERYLMLDPKRPVNTFSYAVAWEWFARRMGTPNPTLDQLLTSPDRVAINEEFLGFVYAQYYRIASEAIRAIDPDHLYLGSRCNSNCRTSEDYLRAAGYYLDIVSVNLYGGLSPDATTITNFYRCSGKPFLVTEFYAKAKDALDANDCLLLNQNNAGCLVDTQQDRAVYYEHYTLALLESGSCVGWAWYRFRDNDQTIYQTSSGTLLRMTDCNYTTKVPLSYTDADGNIVSVDDAGKLTVYYQGEGVNSNQGSNKGIYNGNLESYAAVYTYKDGKLVSSDMIRIETPESRTPQTVVKISDGSTLTLGTVTEGDTVVTTILAVYCGVYQPLYDSYNAINHSVFGLISYFDAQ